MRTLSSSNRVKLVTLLTLALSGILSAAEAPPMSLQIWEYFHTAWSSKDGAPSGVQAMAQTVDGMLWLGSHSGLHQFDGVHFNRVNRIDATDLPDGEVYALLATRNGGLWISYLFGGTYLIQNGMARHFSPNDGLPSGTVTAYAEDAEGTVWATSTAGLFRWQGNRWEDMGELSGLGKRFIRSIAIDSEQTVWLNSGGSMLFRRKGTSQFQEAPWHIDPAVNPVIARSRTGTAWIATLIDGRPAAIHLSLDAVGQPSPADIVWLDKGSESIDVVDDDGGLWIDSGASLARVAAGTSSFAFSTVDSRRTFRLPEQASGTGVQYGFQDREGDVWLGTTGGIDRFRTTRIRSVPMTVGEITIVPGDQNALWVGLDRSPAISRGLYQLNAGMELHKDPGVQGISSSLRNPQGTVWLGGPGGIWERKGNSWASIDTPVDLRASEGSEVQALAEDSRGELWVSITRHGLFRRTVGGWQAFLPPTIGSTEYPYVIASDAGHSLYFGYGNNRVATWDSKNSRTYSAADGVDVGGVLAMGQVNGELWIGGVAGLQRFDGSRFQDVSFVANPKIDGVTGILQSRRGELWLNTNGGIRHVSAPDLALAKIAPSAPLHAEILNYLDGLLGSPTPIRPLPTACETDDGRIWFTTTNGLFWTDPAVPTREPVPPTVLVTNLVADGHRKDPAQSLLLAKYTRNLEIDYTATSLAIPERVIFKYRLKERDPSWQDVGTRRAAYFTDLPPGQYTFEVTASNSDGQWNGVGARLTFNVAPALLQTAWFRVLAVIAVGAVLLVIFILRLRAMEAVLRQRIEHRAEIRVEERTRIARELHDSLLQGFQGLMFRLQAVRQMLPSRAVDAIGVLDAALGEGDSAINEARDAVHELRDATLSQSELPDILIALGDEFGGTSPIPRPAYQVVIEGHVQQLDPIVRDEIYRIAREAVRNAFHHARAQRIEAELSFGPSLFFLRVRDDGTGIAREVLRQGRREGHWGLPGMRERAASFGGQLEIWSEMGAGTEVELCIPRRRAYPKHRQSWWRLITGIPSR